MNPERFLTVTVSCLYQKESRGPTPSGNWICFPQAADQIRFRKKGLFYNSVAHGPQRRLAGKRVGSRCGTVKDAFTAGARHALAASRAAAIEAQIDARLRYAS